MCVSKKNECSCSSKSSIKNKAEAYYDFILKKIAYKMVGKDTTYLDKLNEVGKTLFGKKFIGVFPSNRIPRLKNNQYVILNLDKEGEAGSHWVSVVKHKNKSYLYDSFGRKAKKIIPDLLKSNNGKVINTELDAEQKKIEFDCGARVITSLIIMDLFGINYFKML
jgi:hypothetical protein